MQIYVKQVMPVIYYPDKTCYKNKKSLKLWSFLPKMFGSMQLSSLVWKKLIKFYES